MTGTLLDRYLYAVESALPQNDSRDDIVAEIRDGLQSQAETRASELGRPLTGDEEAALLKAFGHPRVVASRYQPVQYLIGPDLLPFYWTTVRTVLTFAVAIELIGGAIAAIVAKDGLLFFDALAAAWHSAIWIFAIVTGIFVVAERVERRDGGRFGSVPPSWDPRRLPSPSYREPVSRPGALIEFIANALALLVLLDAPGPHRIPLDAFVASLLQQQHVALTAALHPAFIAAIIGTALVSIAAIAAFVRPTLVVLHESTQAVASLAIVAGIAMTLTRGPWVQPAPGGWNTAVLYVLVSAAMILAFQAVTSVRELLRKPRASTGATARLSL